MSGAQTGPTMSPAPRPASFRKERHLLKHFEHIGMATGNLDACLGFYVGLLGLELVLRKSAPKGGGELAFADAGGAMLEIFAPPGPMQAPARRLPDNEVGVRHLTFTFENVDETHARLMAAGVENVEAPRDAFNRELFSRVAFVRDPDGNVVELVQRQISAP